MLGATVGFSFLPPHDTKWVSGETMKVTGSATAKLRHCQYMLAANSATLPKLIVKPVVFGAFEPPRANLHFPVPVFDRRVVTVVSSVVPAMAYTSDTSSMQ